MGYDYSKDGWYFVTICTNSKGNILGEIKDGVMYLNEFGELVRRQWLWMENRFNYLKFDEWIIMPDHIHGIMLIDDVVGNGCDRSVQIQKIKSISELIGAFKTTSSKMVHNLGIIGFRWHKSFYDEIIRDQKSLGRIRKYIIENPKNFLKSKL